VTFFPMHISGLLGMPRRIYTYGEDTGWGIYNLVSTIGVFIIVPGIAVFVWNVVRTLRRGDPAGNNPWGGDTLEWAASSPPAEHGWTVLPIVRSRHPMWDQKELHRGEERLERFVRSLAEWPLRWRAAVIVGTADARPQEVFRVAGPSIWPLVAACGLVLIFVAELVKVRWVIAAGALILTAAVIRWNRPEEPPMTVEEEDAFEREHGVPVNAGGSVVVATWAMGLLILFMAIAFSALLLSYFYLRLENPTWPPPGISNPGLGWAIAAAALVVLSGRGVYAALGRVRSGDQPGFIGALVVTLVLAGAGAALQFRDVAQFEFGGTHHAYGSIFYTLAGFIFVAAAAGLIMLAMTLFYAVRGQYDSRRHATVANIARYWTAAVVVWVIGFGTLYIGPRLT
jgi:cytochrome c oxidase subunit I+III